MTAETMARADILIVTALAVERESVRRHLSDVHVVRSGTTTGDLGVFESDGTTVCVAVIETGAGNVHASTATSAALRDLGPETVVVIGIAGGVKDVSIGDVVASRKVYWVESGKVEGNQTEGAAGRVADRTRPDFGPVSNRLVQTARGVVANGTWQRRGPAEDARRLNGEQARALVSPLAIVEKVVADGQSTLAIAIRQSFSDAVALAMEEFGVLSAVAQHESAAAIAVRGISDMLDDKSRTDEQGGQDLAAANAAAFAFELLALDIRLASETASTEAKPTDLTGIAAALYPTGPSDRSIWQRGGGDLSRISLEGVGHARWWSALEQLRLGGGGGTISLLSLVEVMVYDFPNHEELMRFARRL